MYASLVSLSFAAFLVAHFFALIAMPKIASGDDQLPHGCDAELPHVARCGGKTRASILHQIIFCLKIAASIGRSPSISAPKANVNVKMFIRMSRVGSYAGGDFFPIGEVRPHAETIILHRYYLNWLRMFKHRWAA